MVIISVNLYLTLGLVHTSIQKKFFWNDRTGTYISLQSHETAKHRYVLKSEQTCNYLLERKKLQSRYVVHKMATYDKTKGVHRNCISRKRIARQAGLTQQA